ncbi:MAG: aminotransferase class I/II-fold pyridoxal phosphate-dependent enzyme [Planctomycetota bacterium]|nr:aminotransferase class I/II-fold pyridoxal phosphate-dependent enzyme [Planctomycetota bacterium]
MRILLEDHLRGVESPANLRINDQIKAFRQACRKNGCERPYHHFAFGQSPFPPPPVVVEALAANASEHDYLPTAGLPQLREAIARYHRHHFDIECEADQVVVSPGSKEMIAMILAVLRGTFVIPTPSWVSYLPQAKILKKDVITIRVQKESGRRLTPELLTHTMEHLQADQKILILNHPNNPTGAVYSKEELEGLAEVCRRHGVIVISDEIYALTSFEPEQFTSLMKVYPEGTIVTGGLSKDRSCGGYRLGVGIFPKEPKELIEDVLKIAGSTYSCVAAPIQHAAIVAYSMDDSVEDYVRDCRELNALVGRKASALFAEIPGVEVTVPRGAFYLYVDFNEQRENFQQIGLETAADFARHLIQVEHSAVLPGSALLLPEDDFSARCSYVDYDGEKALAAWRSSRPKTPEDEEAFLREHCSLVVDGVSYIGRYLDQVRSGKMPVHVS